MQPPDGDQLPASSYSALVAEASDAIVFADAEANYVDANPAAEALLGYSREELTCLRVHDVVIEQTTWTDAEYTRFVSEGRWRGEVTLRRKDGTFVHAEARAVTLKLPDGVLYASILREGTVGVARSERLMAAIVESSTQSLDLDELLPAMLERVRELLFSDTATILVPSSSNGTDLVVRASVGLEREKGFRVPIGDGFAGRVAATREAVVVDDTNSIRIVSDVLRNAVRSVAGVPLVAGEQLLGVLHVGSFTSRHFSEEDVALLRLAAERASAAIDRANLYAAERRAASHQALISELAQALAEASPEMNTVLDEFVKRVVPLSDLCTVRLVSPDGAWLDLVAVHGREAAMVAELRQAWGTTRQRFDEGFGGRVLRAGRSIYEPVADQAELRHGNPPAVHPILDRYPVGSLLVIPLTSRGRVLGTVHMIRMATRDGFSDEERLLLEALADRLAVALDNASLFEAERQARTQAEVAVQTRDEFLSSVTHDLQNPLAVIQGQVGLFERRMRRGDPLPSEQLREGLQRIEATAARMSRQLQELLDLARLELGQLLELNAEPVDLVVLLRRLVDELDAQSERHRVRLESADTTSLTGVYDGLRLERVFANLLDNAVKYSPAGDEVVVRVWTDRRGRQDWAVVEVSDHGIGIPADEIEHVFERFFRASNTTRRMAGSGIGLATADQIVRQHGGSIGVTSQAGRGSTFRVELPLQ
jgi:PAS domain S-box-containing protein